jgi:hypothetical protein
MFPGLALSEGTQGTNCSIKRRMNYGITGILPAGPDSYTITEKHSVFFGRADAAKVTALTEADAYCRGQGRRFLPAMMGTVPAPGDCPTRSA